jgi:hypothetical protein
MVEKELRSKDSDNLIKTRVQEILMSGIGNGVKPD